MSFNKLLGMTLFQAYNIPNRLGGLKSYVYDEDIKSETLKEDSRIMNILKNNVKSALGKGQLPPKVYSQIVSSKLKM